MSAAGVTVRDVEPLTLPEVAEMVVEPTANVVASPCVPGLLLIDAVLVALELHVTVEVRSRVLPSV